MVVVRLVNMLVPRLVVLPEDFVAKARALRVLFRIGGILGGLLGLKDVRKTMSKRAYKVLKL